MATQRAPPVINSTPIVTLDEPPAEMTPSALPATTAALIDPSATLTSVGSPVTFASFESLRTAPAIVPPFQTEIHRA